GVGWLAAILYVDAIISPGGTGLIYTTSSSRVSYGLSRNGYFPTAYEATDKRGVPWVGLLTAFVVGCVCFLPFPSWTSLVGLITAASVLMYAGAPLAFGVFRRRLPDAERPWRAPAGPVLAPLAFVVANLLILWSGWDTDWRLGVAIAIGYVILAATRIFNWNARSPQLDLRAASWLPFYLVGMGAIVYLSDFGPLKNPVFPLWWDMVAVAIFSLLIYYWAIAVALPAQRIEAMIGDVVLPEEEGIAGADEPLARGLTARREARCGVSRAAPPRTRSRRALPRRGRTRRRPTRRPRLLPPPARAGRPSPRRRSSARTPSPAAGRSARLRPR